MEEEENQENPSLIYCDICDTHVSGENNLNIHILGKKHIRRRAQMEE